MDNNIIKTKYIRFFLIFVFLIILIFLFKLQIIEYQKYKLIAEKNYVRIQTIEAVRGEIFDKNFNPIASNIPSYDLYVIPGKIRDKKAISEFVGKIFDIDKSEIEKTIYQNRFRLYNEVLLIKNIGFEHLTILSEKLNYFPELVIKSSFKRKYAYPNLFTGYIQQINKKEYKKLKSKGYLINSMIGKTGLEKYYETILKGKNGKHILQVDSRGNNLNLFKNNLEIPALNGKSLVLTIDNDLQNHIRKIFPKDNNGAVVVIDASNGELLAYVNSPDFDQNIFSANIDSETWNNLVANPRKPMMDRISQGVYPPGSIYKLVPASLGLGTHLIEKNTKLISCNGGMQIGNRFYKCWLSSGHGKLSVENAIKYSCDTFFYDLSLQYSLKKMEDFTKENMLTVKTGIDLRGELAGFFPSKKWYVEHYGKYAGTIGKKVNLAIGQGELLITPLQMCAYYAAIANNGLWIQPHFLSKTISDEGDSLFIPQKVNLPVSQENINILQEALYKTVNEKYGTGTKAHIDSLDVYGKTGSAENHKDKKTHAWFSGYAKFPDKTIAFTILVENAGHGGSTAAPIAKDFLVYLKERKNHEKNN